MAGEKDLLYLQDQIEVVRAMARKDGDCGNQVTAEALFAIAEALEIVLERFKAMEDRLELPDMPTAGELEAGEVSDGA